MRKTVYQNILKKRLEKNISQEYMAEQLAITQSYYSKIERGLKDVTLNRLLLICKTLNCDIEDLIVKAN